ncbi:MAG: phosphotransferase [Gemmataceae bacterium]|nr:phosphotransferase [Gemmataceae bacterium]
MPADLAVGPPVAPSSSALPGWLAVHPRYAGRLVWMTADDLLDLPGEVVSGHPDRHVVRVELPGWDRPLYLKREHRVGWRERLRQRLAGFGWASRCGREAAVIRGLAAAGLPCPRWAAYGEDGRGRAFLLVEGLPGVELRRLLSDDRLSPVDRIRLAGRLGRAVAALHAAGFTTPDLSAKHAFVDPETFEVTLIDWQSARRVARVSDRDRLAALALLHASLADDLAGAGDRLRFLRAYRRVAGPVSARAVERLAAKARGRRSVRDQRQPAGALPDQRLVWLAGEAVCAIPEVAAVWPMPAVRPPYYGAPAGPSVIALPDGRSAVLVRGRSVDLLGRLRAWLRGRPWRSPGVALGRVLFHLERYGVPAPRLYAFGQRITGPASAEWFALYEPPAGVPVTDPHRAEPVLRRLHDAGCRYVGRGPLLWVDDAGRVSVGNPAAVRIVRRVTDRDRRADLIRLRAGGTG